MPPLLLSPPYAAILNPATHFISSESMRTRKPCTCPLTLNQEQSSSKEPKRGKLVAKYEKACAEEESGGALFAVDLKPSKPDDLMRPYSRRMHDYMPWR